MPFTCNRNLPLITCLPLCLILCFILTGCAVASPSVINEAKFVDLSDLQPLPETSNQDVKPLRVAISAVISPQGSADSYGPLLTYLEETLGRPVIAIQRRTYSEVNDLVREGGVDIACVCTSQYLVGSREFDMQLLAAPQVNGEAVYRAQIIVPINSSAQSLDDLRAKVFAFTDPISFTGRIYPTYLLQEMAETPESFFARTFFTYSHDDAIYAVANGVTDGASIDALVLDFALSRDPDLQNRVRVIHTSEPFGIPPVVIGPHVRPQLQAELQDTLLNLHLTSEGQNALAALDYDKFVRISPEAYRSAELIETTTGLSALGEE